LRGRKRKEVRGEEGEGRGRGAWCQAIEGAGLITAGFQSALLMDCSCLFLCLSVFLCFSFFSLGVSASLYLSCGCILIWILHSPPPPLDLAAGVLNMIIPNEDGMRGGGGGGVRYQYDEWKQTLSSAEKGGEETDTLG
jgi:hypothetical protein